MCKTNNNSKCTGEKDSPAPPSFAATTNTPGGGAALSRKREPNQKQNCTTYRKAGALKSSNCTSERNANCDKSLAKFSTLFTPTGKSLAIFFSSQMSCCDPACNVHQTNGKVHWFKHWFKLSLRKINICENHVLAFGTER